MKAETFSAEVSAALQALAWDQWVRLGVSGAVPRHPEERAADPEALLLFTLEVGRSDPRLFDFLAHPRGTCAVAVVPSRARNPHLRWLAHNTLTSTPYSRST